MQNLTPHGVQPSEKYVNFEINGYPLVTAMMNSNAPGADGVVLIGDFRGVDGVNAPRLAVWDGDSFAPIGAGNGVSRGPSSHYVSPPYPSFYLPQSETSIVFDDGTGAAIYAAGPGGFGTLIDPWVAKFDGQTWTAVGTNWPRPGVAYRPYAGTVAVYDTPAGPKLYTFGGRVFDEQTPEAELRADEVITRLDGNTWTVVNAPEGTPRTKVGYNITVAENGSSNPPTVYHINLTKWRVDRLEGGALVAVPGSPLLTLFMAACDLEGDGTEALYVAAYGGLVYRYDGGSTWTSIGSLGGSVSSLVPVSDSAGRGLVAGGSFTASGLNRVARWDGTAWSAVGGGITATSTNAASTPFVTSLDIGNGPQLIVGPIYNTAVKPHAYIAAFDGTSWSPINPGNGFQISANTFGIPQNYTRHTGTTALDMISYDDGAGPTLYVFGDFINVDGVPSQGMARFGCPIPETPACPADFNGDEARDVADLFAYINAWLAKTSNADFNDSGNVDVADLFAYINAWLAGC